MLQSISPAALMAMTQHERDQLIRKCRTSSPDAAIQSIQEAIENLERRNKLSSENMINGLKDGSIAALSTNAGAFECGWMDTVNQKARPGFSYGSSRFDPSTRSTAG